MKWIGISGSWRKTNARIERDVRGIVKNIMKRGDGIISGGALGVDYIALDEALKHDKKARRIKIFLPSTIQRHAKHYIQRAGEKVITRKQAMNLIEQLSRLKKANPLAIHETKKVKTLNRKTYYARNTEVVKASKELMAFRVLTEESGSLGTLNTIRQAKKMAKPVRVFTYDLTRPIEKIYLIGIGGIGMSSLAQWYQSQGARVFGSDESDSEITDMLEAKGVAVNKQKLDKTFNLVIYSSAIPTKHRGRKKAKRLGIKQLSYAQALGALTKRYKTIAVCGTHGKSTTTALTALMLEDAGYDPTVIVGTKVPQLQNNNFKSGRSEWLVIEADEYRDAFLNYHPYAVVATNVDADHLDYFKTFANVKKSFTKFLNKVEDGGALILNRDDPFLRGFSPSHNARAHYYSRKMSRANEIGKLLRIPGKHNVSNAMAVDRLGEALGIDKSVKNSVLKNYKGSWRRFEYKGLFGGAKVYDDYAHHPAEIKATLEGAKEAFPKNRIIAVFQPHLTHRLRALFSDFVKSFTDASLVIILETYKVPGRELTSSEDVRTGDVKNAQALALRLNNHKTALYAKNHKEVMGLLNKNARKGDIIILMGAGDITNVASKLVKKSNIND